MGVQLSGVKELKAALKEHERVQNSVGRVVKYHGSKLQENAQRAAPVDTGTLKRSIQLELLDGGMTAEVAATAEYAGYVEWGTRFMAAQPFIRPSFLKQEAAFITDLKKVLE